MSIRRTFRIVAFLLGTICAYIYYSSYSGRQSLTVTHVFDLPRIFTRQFEEDDDSQTKYSVFSSGCKMLAPNPWNPAIKKYLTKPQTLVCSHLPQLTYVEQHQNLSNVLRINQKAVKKYKLIRDQVLKCCYSVITRVEQTAQEYNTSADSLYDFTHCIVFSDQTLLPKGIEFITVLCQIFHYGKKPGKVVYRDVHPVIPILPEVRSKMKYFEKVNNRTPETILENPKPKFEALNVVILGIDSVSKSNLRRVMPKTLKYLLRNDWVELEGYNKVGENTFPNLMAILSGASMHELDDLCWANRSQKTDDCPAIWKEYSKKGYITLYAEDTPSISTFNLLRTGFVQKPTDYYMRPFMLAAHDMIRPKMLNGLPVCLGPVLIIDHVLNYARRFFRAFNNYAFFSLLWLNSLSHNDVNAPGALDTSVLNFLNDLSNIGTYENSLILLLSDHGVRFGAIRETFMGYFEERLPFMFIWLPKWFSEKYPDRYRNLLLNRNRLTSPYDVHVTLKSLLYDDENFEPASSGCPKCTGLLTEQPFNRTCADAAVDINWCLCSGYRTVPVRDNSVSTIAKYLYKYIVDQTNELIKKENVTKSLCSKWKFSKVFRADEILLPKTPVQYSFRNASNAEIRRYENQILDQSTKIYIIIVELQPKKTKFEATVMMKTRPNRKKSTFAFLEPPKRLDSIYKTSHCVQGLLLKHYCICVRQ